MRVGKSEAMRCDHCGEVVIGESDSVKIGDKIRDFCPEAGCMEEWFVERYRPRLLKEAERLYRVEQEHLIKLICPACRYRFITKFNARADQLEIVCPHCNEVIDKAVI